MTQQTIDGKLQFQEQQIAPGAEHQLLNIFVGKWHTEGLSYGSGQSKENPYDSSVRWIGAESYEWLPGGFFLVHHFDGQVGDSPINGMEFIGYDAASQTYTSHSFDNHGKILIGQRSFRDGTWSYIGTDYRNTYVFGNDGNTMTIHWEWLCEKDLFVLADLKSVKVN
jgi:Protein of unknown function (DUF1579)